MTRGRTAAAAAFVVFNLMAAVAALAQDQPADPAAAGARVIGDIGLAANVAPSPAHARDGGTSAIPYANFDYGQLFARIDTFGAKLLPAGDGSVELVTRVLEDGYTPAQAGLAKRRSSVPAGLGTLQTTPLGAIFFNAYHDFNKSHGNLVDLIYAAEIDAGPLAFYPQVGAEYRSSAYTGYFYGVSSTRARQTGLPVYTPQAADDPFAALFIEAHLGGHWYADANLRRSHLAGTLARSPLVGRHTLDSGLLALSYRFE